MYTIILALVFLRSTLASHWVRCVHVCDNSCIIRMSSTCSVCLQTYFQKYDISSDACRCFDNFEPSMFTFDLCCPITCKSCGIYGCMACWENAELFLNTAYTVLECMCNSNYFFDQRERYCKCRSFLQPQKYYFDQQLSTCLECPVNCTCTTDGCIHCEDGYWKVQVNKYNISTCTCARDFVQTNRECQCPLQCTCNETKVVSCSRMSYRMNVYGQWRCKPHFKQLNGVCYCPSLKYILTTDPDGDPICACPNKEYSNMTGFYSDPDIADSCYFCPYQCSCSYGFCYSCTNNSVVQSINGVCYCKKNFTMAQVFCECQYPFYNTRENETTLKQECYCSSELYVSEFYYIVEREQCLVCPKGCFCDYSGCFFCKPNLLRSIYQYSNNQYSCLCKDNSHETQKSVCLCDYMYRYDRATDSCICDYNKVGISFQDTDLQTCQVCPVGCQCNSSGCYSCDSSVLRVIEENSQGIKTCYCMSGMILEQGICSCRHPLTYSQSSSSCQCAEPYQVDSSGQCSCKSIQYPSQYYRDNRNNTCYPCPFNCVCNQSGCVQCDPNALRMPFLISTNQTLWICPCKSIAYYSAQNHVCTKCPPTSYDFSLQCIPCTDCLTCDKRGCLSCLQQMHLFNFTCVCNHPSLLNLGGQCDCPEKYYWVQSPSGGDCRPCPLFCENCVFNTQTMSINCISCNKLKNRDNFPILGCRCIQGFIEMYPSTGFCCPLGCSSCDETGCKSCSLYSYKQLVNSTCVCPQSMIEIATVCYCRFGSYLFGDICVQCPLRCLTCITQCTSCVANMNRNMQPPNCSCIDNFKQTDPVVSEFCIHEFCDEDEVNCTKCIKEMIAVEGVCSCPIFTYQSYLEQCLPCPYFQGCVLCLSSTLCYYCMEFLDFYLSFYKCFLQNVFYHLQIQTQNRVTLQFLSPTPVYYISSIKSVSINPIHSIYNTLVSQLDVPQIIFDYSIKLENSIITITLNLSKPFNNSILEIVGNFVSHQDQIVTLDYDLRTQFPILSTPFSSYEKVFIQTLAILGLVSSLVIHLVGYKFSSLFVLQTLSFEALKLNQTLLSNIYFGHYLKLTAYDFGSTIIEKYLFQEDYIEKSVGNYHFLSKDANMLRALGTNLVVAFINIIFVSLIPIITIINIAFISYLVRKRYFKYLTRTLDFIYKTTMYPLIYYSLQTLLHWKRTSLVLNSIIYNTNILSICILGIYLISTIIQYISILPSKMYKISAITEFVACIVCSLSIILWKDKYWTIVLVIVIMGRDIVYIWLRNKYLRDRYQKKIANYLLLLIEAALITLMIFHLGKWTLIVLVIIVIILRGVVGYLTVSDYNKESKTDKLKGSFDFEQDTVVTIIGVIPQ